MGARVKLALILGATGFVAFESGASSTDSFYADFVDQREPVPYRELTSEERALFDLGVAVFNTQWVVAGTPRAGRRDGLGPVFNAASCDACHNNGARAIAPAHSGALSTGLVIQLSESGDGGSRYGHVLNTSAIEGFATEGRVRVEYEERRGEYPDGQPWTLRVPRYEILDLNPGALAPTAMIKPRLAPALFGVGLLDAVPRSPNGADVKPPRGRFGWQADSPTLADQTARALSREMGLSSSLNAHDDCGTQAKTCLEAASGGNPEVSEEFMLALLAFQNGLAVPRPKGDASTVRDGAALFESAGCTQCHVPELPVEGIDSIRSIRAFTDLRVHDMGPELADRTLEGIPVKSHWRTAPLWGLNLRNRAGRIDSLLHDGRARSIEEAILWHGGEATTARERFRQLSTQQRASVLAWLALH